MDEPGRSPEEFKHNGYSQDLKGKLYLPKSYLLARDQKQSWLLKPILGGKTLWDWLGLLIVPGLIAMIAGVFTLITVSQQNEITKKQNEIFEQRDRAEQDRNQQALLIEYLNEITRLVEKGLLTSSDQSDIQRTIARARTLTLLRALDSDRKGELIQFLNTAQLIKTNQSIIDLRQSDLVSANLRGAELIEANLSGTNLIGTNLRGAKLSRANLSGAELSRANLSGAELSEADLRGAELSRANLSEAELSRANLSGAELSEADLRGAELSRANLSEADLSEADLSGADLIVADLSGANLRVANLSGADLGEAKNLNPKTVKSACNWQQAIYSKTFKEQLAQEPEQKVDCSRWEQSK
ncbi:MAG: pentapeptide repeat-containing protein [Xenococcus sp. MO_188.B8]|nr:pentapeptide repeat-containing protein [Xenococcus sp. MO_188.B8]